MTLSSVAAVLAEGQLGLVARRQLRDAGVPASTIDHAVNRNHLVTVVRGVYRMPGVPVTPVVALRALLLAAGPHAVGSHETAAWIWGLIGTIPDPQHVTVPRWHRHRLPRCVVHESSDLDRALVGTVGGIPVTGVGRTILDCGAHGLAVQPLVDEARRRHRISRTLLPAVIASHARRGRPGIGVLRAAVADDEMPHSDFERMVCTWLGDVGIDGWELHHRILVPDFGPAELDIAWPAARVFLELEGADHRDRSLVHDHDTERQNQLVLAGWYPLRTTYRRWVLDSPTLLREIRRALQR